MAELLLKDPRDYIKFEYELRRARRPSYSMRAFARDLDVSPSSLNDFIKGRVGMSVERVERIATILRWSERRKEHFRDLILARHGTDAGIKQAAQTRIRKRLKDGTFGLSVDSFKAISDWYHLVILEICDCKDHMDAATIARELSLDVATVQRAVKRLTSLGLLTMSPHGLKPTESTSHFGDDAPSEAIISFHCQVMQLAQKALHERPIDERSSLSVFVSLNANELVQMNEEIRKSIMNIVNRYAQGSERNHIHAVSFQSFPVWTASEENK